ncbi:MAG TPA: hypothetical protein VHB79_02330 [Polyangiaceae bacterium]|nr:hypothetical protein [Polyangiaceae bacterium]
MLTRLAGVRNGLPLLSALLAAPSLAFAQAPAAPAAPPTEPASAPAAEFSPAPSADAAAAPPPAGAAPPAAPQAPAAATALEPHQPAGNVPFASEPAEAPAVGALDRRFAFKANFGIGGFDPGDVNRYIKSRVPSNSYQTQGFSEMVLLLSFDVSGAYFPVRFFGIRPNLLYLFAPKVLTVQGGESQGYWLHSIAPGLSLDFVYDTRKVARFFASPGIAYQVGWFEGYEAHGLGLELALGTELSFGERRAKGISLALVVRSADLDVSSAPASFDYETPVIRDLNFTAIMFRVGFQVGM